MSDPTREAEATFRRCRVRVLSALVRFTGDLDSAEDALGDALVAALSAWPSSGVPERPDAWLMAAARNAHRDRLRRAANASRLAPSFGDVTARAIDADEIPEDRLRLIFTCCHPALGDRARVALTLQVVCGLTAEEIGRLLWTPPATVSQSLVRAKRKIRDAGIRYEVPPPEHWAGRLDSVLRVVYLLFTEGYLRTRGDALLSGALAEETLRLGRALVHLLPREPEVLGLTALMVLHDARRLARTDAAGDLIPLDRQDRAAWHRGGIREGLALLERAMTLRAPGRYQIEAAIAAVHAEAPSPEATDWRQIRMLYAALRRFARSPAVALAEAVAIGMADGPEHGLAALDALDAEARTRHAFHAARGELLLRSGDVGGGRAALQYARRLARNTREARHLARRVAELDTGT